MQAERIERVEERSARPGVHETPPRRPRLADAAIGVLAPPNASSLHRLDDDLETLCSSLSEGLGPDGAVRLTLTADPIELTARRSWQAALIAWELIQDAAMRAAASSGERTIAVSARVIVGILLIAVLDDAPACCADCGRDLVTADALAADLGGTIIRRRTKDGAGAVLSVPIGEAHP